MNAYIFSIVGLCKEKVSMWVCGMSGHGFISSLPMDTLAPTQKSRDSFVWSFDWTSCSAYLILILFLFRQCGQKTFV
jgi:hypothetical protein